jgi:hypothetical protein
MIYIQVVLAILTADFIRWLLIATVRTFNDRQKEKRKG